MLRTSAASGSRIEGEELLARAFQHEIDHLDGILFIDRLSRLKKDLTVRKIKKLIKNDEVVAAVDRSGDDPQPVGVGEQLLLNGDETRLLRNAAIRRPHT